MCYGIYDKKSETLIFSNLPGETTYAIVGELLAGSTTYGIVGELLAGSTDKDRYEILVTAADDTYRSVSTGEVVIVKRAL
jgi:hypothetical protein